MGHARRASVGEPEVKGEALVEVRRLNGSLAEKKIHEASTTVKKEGRRERTGCSAGPTAFIGRSMNITPDRSLETQSHQHLRWLAPSVSA